MKKIPPERILPRGRAAHWTRERVDRLSSDDLKALIVNAERLQEPEVAALCREVLASRPRGSKAAAPLALREAK